MRKYFPQGVLWCKKPEREHGARQPLPLTAAVFFCLRGYAAQSRKARCKKQPERRARLFLCPHAAEQAANGWRPQPCPTTSRLCRAIAQSAMQKNSRSAERGCSSALTPPNRRRMVGARNPALPLAGYAAQSREARCKKQPERRARLFLCPHAAEQAANGWSPQPCPTTSRLCRAIAQSAMQKQPER